MKALLVAVTIAASAALVAGAAGSAGAQDYNHGGNDHHGDRGDHAQSYGDYNRQYADHGQHRGWGQDYGNAGHHWNRGERMGYSDWQDAPRVDYRARHLRRPPYGYEWRESNGQYVLAAVATGLIASIIINSGR